MSYVISGGESITIQLNLGQYSAHNYDRVEKSGQHPITRSPVVENYKTVVVKRRLMTKGLHPTRTNSFCKREIYDVPNVLIESLTKRSFPLPAV
jgi:hypothetical protein